MENKQLHLEFIQNIITRMNTNSFQIKGMTVTIVSAILAVYASTKNVLFVFLALLPTLIFWFLDSYYLQQERKFRAVYNNVAGLKNDIEIKSFEMPIHKFTKDEYSYINVLVSKTIVWLYYPILIALLCGGFIIIGSNI